MEHVDKKIEISKDPFQSFMENTVCTKSCSVKFKQNSYSDLRKRISPTDEGTFEWAAPHKFRWETVSQKKELYVSNGKDFWKYNETDNFAQKLPLSDSPLEFLDILTHPKSLKAKFTITKTSWEKVDPTGRCPFVKDKGEPIASTKDSRKDNDRGRVFDVVPKNDVKSVHYAVLLEDEPKMVKEIVIFNPLNSCTQLVFSKISYEDIPNDRFDFSVPKGVAQEPAPSALLK